MGPESGESRSAATAMASTPHGADADADDEPAAGSGDERRSAAEEKAVERTRASPVIVADVNWPPGGEFERRDWFLIALRDPVLRQLADEPRYQNLKSKINIPPSPQNEIALSQFTPIRSANGWFIRVLTVFPR